MKAKSYWVIIKRHVSKNRYWDILILFGLTFIIYVHNLSPSVFGGDSGDIITAAITKGVPHPSGYPLQTMLGILFLKIPIQATPAWKVGLVSSLFSAFTIVVFYKTCLVLTKNKVLSFITALVLAFTYTFWLFAEVGEVFGLHHFFVSLVIYLTIKYFENKKDKYLLWLAFVAGLALTNNQIIILFLFSSALTIFIFNPRLIFNFRLIARSIFFLFLGLLPYLYIPLAARKFPDYNWGFAANLENFMDLVTRKQYGWATSSISERFTLENLIHRLSTYFDYWKVYIHPLVLPLAILGLAFLYVKNKKIQLLYFLVTFIIIGPLFMVYSGTDIVNLLIVATLEKFLISNFLIVCLLLPFGILALQEVINKLPLRKQISTVFINIIIVVYTLIPITLFIVNFNKTKLKDVYIGDNLALDVLSSLPSDGVLLLRADSLIFNAIYYQSAFNYRTDVAIPGPHDGYQIFLKETGVSDSEILKFSIENKGMLDNNDIYAALVPVMKKRDVFVDGPLTIEDFDYGGITVVPYGLVYKLELAENLPYDEEIYANSLESALATYHLSELDSHEGIFSDSLIMANIKKLYSVGYFNIADYYKRQYGNDEKGQEYLMKSISIDPLSTE